MAPTRGAKALELCAATHARATTFRELSIDTHARMRRGASYQIELELNRGNGEGGIVYSLHCHPSVTTPKTACSEDHTRLRQQSRRSSACTALWPVHMRTSNDTKSKRATRQRALVFAQGGGRASTTLFGPGQPGANNINTWRSGTRKKEKQLSGETDAALQPPRHLESSLAIGRAVQAH